MLYNVLAATAEKTRDVTVGEASLYALLGFGIVFLGIAFLILVVWLVGKVMQKGASVKKEAKPVEVAKPAPSENSDEITEETVAVITAAIMAYYAQSNRKCEFTVKRIKRI